MKRRLFAIMLVLVMMVSGSIQLNSAHAATQGVLGGLDLWQWCLQKQQGEQHNPLVLESPGNAYNWKCRSVAPVPHPYPGGPTYSIIHTGIDTNAVCRWQYQNGSAYARTNNWQDPNSWNCYLD